MTNERFDVRSWVQQYTVKQPAATAVSKPKVVTFWTKKTDAEGEAYLFGDESGLSEYKPPQLPADLSAGFPDRYHAKDESAISPVDTVVTAALNQGHDLSQTDICTYRNNLNKILLTPIDRNKEWAINFCYIGSSLFLDITKVGQATYADQDKFCYFGYHFESICSGHAPGAAVVDPSNEFSIVVHYRLGAHTVLMGAEVDGYDPQAPLEAGPTHGRPYVEMKTYRIPSHRKGEAALYGDKHPRWWVQSFLAGVPLMVLGGRDDKGMLQKVHQVSVLKLPELSAAAGMPWDPNLLLGFGEAVLDWMLQLAAAAPGIQLCARYNPSEAAITSQVVHADEEGGGMVNRLEQLLAQRQQLGGDAGDDRG